jgi:hypothetical protein
LGERVVRNDEVSGSIPLSSTIFSNTNKTSQNQCVMSALVRFRLAVAATLLLTAVTLIAAVLV